MLIKRGTAHGGLICGFFWEMWNYFSYPKWKYDLPGLNGMYIFEMLLPVFATTKTTCQQKNTKCYITLPRFNLILVLFKGHAENNVTSFVEVIPHYYYLSKNYCMPARNPPLLLLLAILVLLQASGNPDKRATAADKPGAFRTEEAFPLLHFDFPVDITHSNDGTNRLFVVEQAGVIKVFENKRTTAKASRFLDIRNKVSYGGEAGLLGLAFHPDYRYNGYFYVNYTTKAAGRLETVIVRYQVSSSNPNLADPASEKVLLRFDQPWDNHNGGAVKFGPDGYLYIATGDGGSWGDPHNNAQNKKVLLGKILRIDVNGAGKGNYSIPPDNPFAGNSEGLREEIYAYGLRNPWRISFDYQTNTLWAGDVGQNKHEEIDIIVKGGNYGWSRKEGIECYRTRNCDDPAFIDPVLDMPQANGERSITGGFVYRGKKLPSLSGKYIFGDYVSGRIFALETKRGKAVKNSLLVDKAGQISSFGVDADNELLICIHLTGKILRLSTQ